MLKILSTKLAELKKVVIGGSGSKKKYVDKVEPVDNKVGNNKFEKIDKKTSKSKKLFKPKKLFKSKKMVGLDFFIPKARLAFIKLRQAFVKALIFYHFDSKRYIRIKTDVLGYAIIEVLSQLTLDDLGQYHPVAFFS